MSEKLIFRTLALSCVLKSVYIVSIALCACWFQDVTIIWWMLLVLFLGFPIARNAESDVKKDEVKNG